MPALVLLLALAALDGTASVPGAATLTLPAVCVMPANARVQGDDDATVDLFDDHADDRDRDERHDAVQPSPTPAPLTLPRIAFASQDAPPAARVPGRMHGPLARGPPSSAIRNLRP